MHIYIHNIYILELLLNWYAYFEMDEVKLDTLDTLIESTSVHFVQHSNERCHLSPLWSSLAVWLAPTLYDPMTKDSHDVAQAQQWLHCKCWKRCVSEWLLGYEVHMSRWTLHANSKNVSSGEGTGTGVPEFIEHHATVTEWRLYGSNSLSTQPIYNDTMKEHVKKHHRNKFERQVVLPGNEHSRRSATCCDLYLINDVFLSNDTKWKSCSHIEPSLPEMSGTLPSSSIMWVDSFMFIHTIWI